VQYVYAQTGVLWLLIFFSFTSQAVLVDKTLYISGQLGLDAQTGSLVPGGVVPEAKKALDNMGFILEAAGISFKNGR
jgi:enamine deaminase RidA (YjgF/YER057c/UK114 family)